MNATTIDQIAADLRVEPAVIRTIAAVESGGIPGVVGDWPCMRMEVNHVWKRWPEPHRDLLDHLTRVDGPKPWQGHRVLLPPPQVPDGAVVVEVQSMGGHTWVRMHVPSNNWRVAQAVEQAALSMLTVVASGIPTPWSTKARAALFEATSWGQFQLMGWDHGAYGFETAEAMATAFRDEDLSLQAFAHRVTKLRPKEVIALRLRDWDGFALSYNGPGQVDWYATKMREAYQRLRSK